MPGEIGGWRGRGWGRKREEGGSGFASTSHTPYPRLGGRVGDGGHSGNSEASTPDLDGSSSIPIMGDDGCVVERLCYSWPE
jgi:hypothetical protein